MTQSNGKMCGICGKYIELPSMWSGSLPVMCNGIHQAVSSQIELNYINGELLKRLDRIIELLDDYREFLALSREHGGLQVDDPREIKDWRDYLKEYRKQKLDKK